MHENLKKTKRWLRSGAAACLSGLLLFSALTGTAQAAPAGAALSSARELVPVGHTIGIKLFARGVVVVGLMKGSTPAGKGGLEKGDVILKCGGETVTSTEQFQARLQSSGGAAIPLRIRRGGSVKNLSVVPEQNGSGAYVIGAWIRDSMAGIGSMTFYDPASGVFGALGHGINDTDTAVLMPFSSGSILPSKVKAVKKGVSGAAGELRGDFDLTRSLGELYANTAGGIFGTMEENDLTENLGPAIPVAENTEVKTGAARILCNVAGDQVREYDVEITRLYAGGSDFRDLLVRVTDPELIALTGGIVQGMSGAPIVQNGKLVGAVTHVLLNDPTRGYGILIRNMLECGDAQAEENAS